MAPTGPEGWYLAAACARPHVPPTPALAGLPGPASLYMSPPRDRAGCAGITLPHTHPVPIPTPVHHCPYTSDTRVLTARTPVSGTP